MAQAKELGWDKAMINYNGREVGGRSALVGQGEPSGEKQRRWKLRREDLSGWWSMVKDLPAPRLSNGGKAGFFGEWSSKPGGARG